MLTTVTEVWKICAVSVLETSRAVWEYSALRVRAVIVSRTIRGFRYT